MSGVGYRRDKAERQARAESKRPFITGFCGMGNPSDSHDRCPIELYGYRCNCACHQPPAAEAAPSTVNEVPSEPVAAATVLAPRSPGLYDGVPEEEYHRDPALSSSGAKLLLPPSCPATFRWRMDNPPEPSPVFDLGHAAHMIVLGVGAPIRTIDADDWRSKAAREARDEARADGATPLLKTDHERVLAMADSVRRHPIAGRIFDAEHGQAEQSLWWTDAETGVRRRARLDWLPRPSTGRMVVSDLKTARSANPALFGKAAADFGYEIQAPWYLDALAANDVADDAAFVFVLVEKEPPYLVSVVQLDDEAMLLGRNLARKALGIYADCLRDDAWPGYSGNVELVSLPAWFTRTHFEELYA